MFRLTLILSFLLSSFAFAEVCKNPTENVRFGKVLAVCDDHVVTYVGDQAWRVLGVRATTSRFELVTCRGLRYDLHLDTNSEGFVLEHRSYNDKDWAKVIRMWGNFEMVQMKDGKKRKVKCTKYKDTRKNIDYIDPPAKGL